MKTKSLITRKLAAEHDAPFSDFSVTWLCLSLSPGGLWSVFTLGGAGSKAGIDEEHNPLPLSNQSLLLLLVLANLTDGPDWPNPYRQAITCFRNTQGNVKSTRSVVHKRALNNGCSGKMISTMFPSARRHDVVVRGAAPLVPNQLQQPVHSAVRAAAVRPGDAAPVHAPSPEHQHEDLHAFQDRHGQSGRWDGAEGRRVDAAPAAFTGLIRQPASGTITKIAVKNESNRIVNPKQNALYNRWLQTWWGGGVAMKSFHLGPALRLSKQRGCMQWQLVMFSPDGMEPIILFNRVNLWRHFLSESQSSCVTHTTNNAGENHSILFSRDTERKKKEKADDQIQRILSWIFLCVLVIRRVRLRTAQPVSPVFLPGSAHPGDPLPRGGQEFSSRLHGPHYSAHSHRG